MKDFEIKEAMQTTQGSKSHSLTKIENLVKEGMTSLEEALRVRY